MSKVNKKLYLSLAGLAICLSQSLAAMTVQELHDLIESGNKLTVIDVRNLTAYENSHIPGSINIPASLMVNKKLPPLGQVVVYGDGIHTEKADNAANALNQKRGIQADVLEGGISAWQSLNMPDTRIAGMSKTKYSYITYQELLEFVSGNTDLVLVDLRQPKNDQILSDLDLQFPGVEVIKPASRINPKNNKESKFRLRSLMRRQKRLVPPLLVLIDNGDEVSEKIYRRLGASRIKRLAILVGGELILSRQGESGQQKRIDGTGGEIQ